MTPWLAEESDRQIITGAASVAVTMQMVSIRALQQSQQPLGVATTCLRDNLPPPLIPRARYVVRFGAPVSH